MGHRRVQAHLFSTLDQNYLRIVDGDFNGSEMEIPQRLLNGQVYPVMLIRCVHAGPHIAWMFNLIISISVELVMMYL